MFPRLRLLLPIGPPRSPGSFQATQAFSSRSLTYSWTQASLGSAQTCRPFLVWKLWRKWKDYTLRNPEGGPGTTVAPPPHIFSWAIQGPAHFLRDPLPISVQAAAPTDSRAPSEDPAAASFLSLPSRLGQPSLTLKAPGQVRSHLRDLGPPYLLRRPGGQGLFRMAPLACLCPWALPPLHTLSLSPEVGRKTATYMTPGLEHWLLVSK